MTITKREWIAWSFSVATLHFYVVACGLPAVDNGYQGSPGPFSGGGGGIQRGIFALLFGWIDLIKVKSGVTWQQQVSLHAWLANPLGLVGLILLGFRLSAPAAVASFLALALGIWYLIYPNGTPLVGAYIWVASMAVLLTGAIVVMIVGLLSKRMTL